MRFFRGFGRQQAPPSSAVAKQRLKVVLVSDQMRMSPGLLAAIRADLVDVLSRGVGGGGGGGKGGGGWRTVKVRNVP